MATSEEDFAWGTIKTRTVSQPLHAGTTAPTLQYGEFRLWRKSATRWAGRQRLPRPWRFQASLRRATARSQQSLGLFLCDFGRPIVFE